MMKSLYSHDDISRSHSETLGQEFAEYVTSSRPAGLVDSLSRGLADGLADNLSRGLGLSRGGLVTSSSRDTSPTLAERLEGVSFRESPPAVTGVVGAGGGDKLECVREVPDNQDITTITQHPKYNTKVKFMLLLCKNLGLYMLYTYHISCHSAFFSSV